jgi:ABC-2 type transport system ATP-binding protein
MKIKLDNINHTYPNTNNSLQIKSLKLNNGITGLLGVNGAGKTTLLNILATVISPQSGKYTLDDIDIVNNPLVIREMLGYLPQNIGFLQELSVFQYIKYIGLLKGCSSSYLKKEIDTILELLNIANVKHIQIKELSGGMKQRVGIAQAIINKPKFLILDEPMVGLDPNERNSFNLLLSEIAKNSVILISSHIIEDLENICENVILMESMKIIYNGKTTQLVSSVNDLVFEKIISRNELETISRNHILIRSKPIGDNLKVRFIAKQKIEATKVSPTLEDAFIYKSK